MTCRACILFILSTRRRKHFRVRGDNMESQEDERLGMHEPITRRDFVNGTLAAGAGMLLGARAPVTLPEADDDWTGYGGVGDYARSNGNTHDVMTVAHAMRDGQFERASVVDTGETYDVAIVGGGLSGLAAAVCSQKREGGRSLVLANHALFGGEATRNEFPV